MRQSPKSKPGLIVALAIVFLGLAFVFGEDNSSPAASETQTALTLKAAMKTKAILDRAVEVYGGKALLDGINNVELVVSGTFYSTISGEGLVGFSNIENSGGGKKRLGSSLASRSNTS